MSLHLIVRAGRGMNLIVTLRLTPAKPTLL